MPFAASAGSCAAAAIMVLFWRTALSPLVLLGGAGIGLAVAALASARRRPDSARRHAAALACGVAGGMLGSAALVAALIVF